MSITGKLQVSKVDHEQQFMVGVGIISKDVFLGDPLAVSKMVKEELGKVESVRVKRCGMMLILCQQCKSRKLCDSTRCGRTMWKAMTFRVGHRLKVSSLVLRWT